MGISSNASSEIGWEVIHLEKVQFDSGVVCSQELFSEVVCKISCLVLIKKYFSFVQPDLQIIFPWILSIVSCFQWLLNYHSELE